MPRIKAAVGLLAIAVFCIGFNAVRYPAVWDMVAAPTEMADSQRHGQSAGRRTAPDGSPARSPLLSIEGGKSADSRELSAGTETAGWLGSISGNRPGRGGVSTQPAEESAASASQWGSGQAEGASSDQTSDEADTAWSAGQYGHSAGTHVPDVAGDSDAFEGGELDFTHGGTYWDSGGRDYGAKTFAHRPDDYAASAEGHPGHSESQESYKSGGYRDARDEDRATGSQSQKTAATKAPKTADQARKTKAARPKASVASTAGAQNRAGKAESAGAPGRQSAHKSSTAAKAKSPGAKRAGAPKTRPAPASLASNTFGQTSRSPETPPASPAAHQDPYGPAASATQSRDSADSASSEHTDSISSGDGGLRYTNKQKSLSDLAWGETVWSGSRATDEAARQPGGLRSDESACTGPMCSLAGGRLLADSRNSRGASDSGVAGATSDPSGDSQRAWPRDGLPPMVPVVATSNRFGDSDAYSDRSGASFGEDGGLAATQQASPDARAWPSSSADPPNSWDRATWPGTGSTFSSESHEVRRLPPVEPGDGAGLAHSDAALEAGADGSLPIYPVTRRQ